MTFVKSWMQKQKQTSFSISQTNFPTWENLSFLLFVNPILYSFILSVVPVSLSGMVPDQENFTAQSLLSKFALDLPKSHPWPHWMEDQQGGECVTWHRWQEETVCHSLTMPYCLCAVWSWGNPELHGCYTQTQTPFPVLKFRCCVSSLRNAKQVFMVETSEGS